jgi:hypothetical protein
MGKLNVEPARLAEHNPAAIDFVDSAAPDVGATGAAVVLGLEPFIHHDAVGELAVVAPRAELAKPSDDSLAAADHIPLEAFAVVEPALHDAVGVAVADGGGSSNDFGVGHGTSFRVGRKGQH